MTQWHEERLTEVLRKLAAEFVGEHSNRRSLITVTDIKLAERGSKAMVSVSVYPDSQSPQALGFLMRKRGDFREMIKARMPGLRRVPHIDFEIKKAENI